MLCYEIEPPPSNLTCYHLVYQDYHRKTDWTNTSTIFHTSYCLGLEINFYEPPWTKFFSHSNGNFPKSQLAKIIFFMILRCISMTTIKSHRDIFAGDEFWWLTRAKVRHCLLCESRALSPRGSWVRIQIGRPTRNSVKILILIWKLVTQTGKRIVKLWCRDKCVEWGTIDVPT